MTQGYLPAPGPSDVHLWQLDLDRSGAAGEESRALLSVGEAERAARFRRVQHRDRYIAGRAALRRLLSGYTGVGASSIRFAYGLHGKPSLEPMGGYVALQFNLAHSAGIGVCAVTWDRAVGVDIEQVRDDWDLDSMMRPILELRERTEVLGSAEPAWSFARLWVRREAVLKATGAGFSGGTVGQPEDAADWSVRDIPVPAGCVGAVAVKGDAVISSIPFA